jgi:hypothetical protein
MKITKQNILSFFEKCEPGSQIPGLLERNVFVFVGLEKYPVRGKYSHLKGSDIVIIESANRKQRSRISLFLDPIVMLANCRLDEIGYGKIPSGFVVLEHAENGPTFPNLFEHYHHYAAVARFIKRQLGDME